MKDKIKNRLKEFGINVNHYCDSETPENVMAFITDDGKAYLSCQLDDNNETVEIYAQRIKVAYEAYKNNENI